MAAAVAEPVPAKRVSRLRFILDRRDVLGAFFVAPAILYVLLLVGVPFLLAAFFVDRAARVTSRLRRFGAVLQTVGGLVMVAIGVAMMTGTMTVFAFWLLKTFPVFGRIG